MPKHVKTQLREAAQSALTGLTQTGSRVYLGRHYPLYIEAGPVLAIHVTGSDNQRNDVGDVSRFIDLVVIAMVSGGADFEDVLDLVQVEVEAAIETDATLKALCQDIWLGDETTEMETEGETRLGQLSLTFTAHINTARGIPDIAE